MTAHKDLIVLTPLGYFIRIHCGGDMSGQCHIGTNDNEYHALLQAELNSFFGSLDELEEKLFVVAARHGLLTYRKDTIKDIKHSCWSKRHGCVLHPEQNPYLVVCSCGSGECWECQKQMLTEAFPERTCNCNSPHCATCNLYKELAKEAQHDNRKI